jgi:hypothetical protein
MPDPYLPSRSAYGPGGAGARPGWLTAVSVIAIVLGALGLLGSLFQTASLVFSDRLQQLTAAVSAPPGTPPEMQKVQVEMQRDIMAVQRRWRTSTMVLIASILVLASLLLLGGIKSLQLSPLGRTVLLATFAALAIVEIGRFIQLVGVQMDSTKVVSEYMPRIMAAAQGAGGKAMPPQAQQVMKTTSEVTVKVSLVAGLAVWGVWFLAKIVFYVLGLFYLTRPHIQAVFQQPARAGRD